MNAAYACIHTYRGGPSCESAETVHTRTHKAVFDRRRHVKGSAVTQNEGTGSRQRTDIQTDGYGYGREIVYKKPHPSLARSQNSQCQGCRRTLGQGSAVNCILIIMLNFSANKEGESSAIYIYKSSN